MSTKLKEKKDRCRRGRGLTHIKSVVLCRVKFHGNATPQEPASSIKILEGVIPRVFGHEKKGIEWGLQLEELQFTGSAGLLTYENGTAHISGLYKLNPSYHMDEIPYLGVTLDKKKPFLLFFLITLAVVVFEKFFWRFEMSCFFKQCK